MDCTCQRCARCIGARLENLMQLFGCDWLGALCRLSGHDIKCTTLVCARTKETEP